MSFNCIDPDFEARVRENFARQRLMSHIGAKLVKTEPGACEIRIAFNENLTQQDGFFHAGIVGTLADNVAGYAAYSLMGKNSRVLTVEFKLNLLAPADGELLVGRGHVLKYGKTLTVCRADIFIVKKGIEKVCAAAQSTLIELRGE